METTGRFEHSSNTVRKTQRDSAQGTRHRLLLLLPALSVTIDVSDADQLIAKIFRFQVK